MTVQETIVARQLRHYYNEVMEINEDLENEEMNLGESERALIQLDEKYAHIITNLFVDAGDLL